MQRIVVTSFLRYNRDILILKRSQSVRTMRGLWSGVSGTIEADESPLERAMIEIYEETKIKPNELDLACTGQVILVSTSQYMDRWEVHPFLFDVYDDTVHLNWENEEYRWIKPENITKYDTVPKLDEMLFSMF